MSTVPDSGSHWNAGRVAVLVSGAVVALIGVGLVLGGLALALAHGFARDSDGYYTTGTERLSTGTHALTVEDVDLGKRRRRPRARGRSRHRARACRAARRTTRFRRDRPP